MISTLADFGIPAEKIRLVFNRVDSDVTEEFAHVVNFVKKEKNATINLLKLRSLKANCSTRSRSKN